MKRSLREFARWPIRWRALQAGTVGEGYGMRRAARSVGSGMLDWLKDGADRRGDGFGVMARKMAREVNDGKGDD